MSKYLNPMGLDGAIIRSSMDVDQYNIIGGLHILLELAGDTIIWKIRSWNSRLRNSTQYIEYLLTAILVWTRL